MPFDAVLASEAFRDEEVNLMSAAFHDTYTFPILLLDIVTVITIRAFQRTKQLAPGIPSGRG